MKVDSLKWIASRLFPKRYDDKIELLGQSEESSTGFTISWLREPSDAKPPVVRQPPKQITYKKPELPADLTERDWSVMLEVLELVKHTIPTDGDGAPSEVFEVLRQAVPKEALSGGNHQAGSREPA